MSYKAKVKLGAAVIEVEADNVKDLFKKMTDFAELPTKSDTGGTNLMPMCRIATSKKDGKTYEYYQLRDMESRKCFDLGQKQEGGGLFPKYKSDRVGAVDGWYAPWEQGTGGEAPASSSAPSADDGDDIPF